MYDIISQNFPLNSLQIEASIKISTSAQCDNSELMGIYKAYVIHRFTDILL